jgi:riboflavin synthase
MFTGIVEEIGEIKQIIPIRNGLRIGVQADKIFDDLKIDDSVNINGACQTVIEIHKPLFFVEAVGDTINKTTFHLFKIGQKVNLERALLPTSRMGGHIVQGHVNGVGEVKKIEIPGENWMLHLNVPPFLTKYCVPEGSICIDGVSLTIAETYQDGIRISVIPHTLKRTIIGTYQVGTKVNIEVDILVKYLESIIQNRGKNFRYNMDDLKKWGF